MSGKNGWRVQDEATGWEIEVVDAFNVNLRQWKGDTHHKIAVRLTMMGDYGGDHDFVMIRERFGTEGRELKGENIYRPGQELPEGIKEALALALEAKAQWEALEESITSGVGGRNHDRYARSGGGHSR